MTVAVASQLTGVPVRTLHRWVSRGQLHAMVGQHGRLVDLEEVRRLAAMAGHPAATPETMTGHSATGTPPAQDDAPWQAMTELIAVNDRLSRENVELAGRVGFLQAEVLRLKEQVALLEAPKPDPSDPAPVERPIHSGEGQNEALQACERPAQRPWWRFWAIW